MRDEQYYALANLVKRPMRRWWAKVGSWWLVGLGLLLVAQAVQTGFEIQIRSHGLWGNPIYRSGWFQMVSGVCWTIPEISVSAAILCASNVIAVANIIVKETLAFSEPLVRVYKFKIALLNCWPFLVSIILAGIIRNIELEYVFFTGPESKWLLTLAGIQSMQHHLIWIVLLVAFTIATDKIRWPAWVMLLGGLVATSAITMLHACIPFQFELFPSYWLKEFLDIQESILMGFCLIIIYGMLYLYLAGKARIANGICLGFSMILLLDGIDAGFGIFPLDHLLQIGKHFQLGLQPVALFYLGNVSSLVNPGLIMDIGGYHYYFQAGPIWAIVPVLNGIFWLFAHYFAFSWLMGRDWRKRKRSIEG